MFGRCLADYHMLSSADVCFFVFEFNQRLGWNTNIPTNNPLFYNYITLHYHVQDFNFVRKRPYCLCFYPLLQMIKSEKKNNFLFCFSQSNFIHWISFSLKSSDWYAFHPIHRRLSIFCLQFISIRFSLHS